MNAPLSPLADTRRTMPASIAARLDHARHAVAALAAEQRRFERLGFELPLARCHQQLRYWRFVDGLLSVAAGETRAAERNRSWPDAAR